MSVTPEHAVVWMEIPVADLARAQAFYEAVLDCEMVHNTDGPNPIVMFQTTDEMTGVAGHLYEGTPAKDAGPTIHFLVPDTVEAASARVWDAGGKVLPGVIDIPAGRFSYATDPDGNSISLFELTAG
ncbi:MAG: VOC family protein [Pseudomonadota bacterium]